jgi:hypothetical protein
MSSVPSLYIAGSRTKGSGGEENVGAHVPAFSESPPGKSERAQSSS